MKEVDVVARVCGMDGVGGGGDRDGVVLLLVRVRGNGKRGVASRRPCPTWVNTCILY